MLMEAWFGDNSDLDMIYLKLCNAGYQNRLLQDCFEIIVTFQHLQTHYFIWAKCFRSGIFAHDCMHEVISLVIIYTCVSTQGISEPLAYQISNFKLSSIQDTSHASVTRLHYVFYYFKLCSSLYNTIIEILDYVNSIYVKAYIELSISSKKT
jgi:hypothetical protein